MSDKNVRGFLERQPDIRLRKPQGSIHQDTDFNKGMVNKFFEICKDLLHNFSFKSRQSRDMDETGTTPVQTPSQVLAKCGKRCVGALTGAERDEPVTAVASYSAAGH